MPARPASSPGVLCLFSLQACAVSGAGWGCGWLLFPAVQKFLDFSSSLRPSRCVPWSVSPTTPSLPSTGRVAQHLCEYCCLWSAMVRFTSLGSILPSLGLQTPHRIVSNSQATKGFYLGFSTDASPYQGLRAGCASCLLAHVLLFLVPSEDPAPTFIARIR